MPSRPLSPPTPRSLHRPNSKLLLLVLLLSVSCFLFLTVLVLLLVYLYVRLLRRAPTLPLDVAPPEAARPTSRRLRRFTHRELRAATAGFNPARALGRGASAAVFRGLLPDGKSVAVKQLLPGTAAPSAGDREFQNELQVLGAVPLSPFVVSLLGYCLEGRNPRRRRQLLVYEYVPGGSLQEALFGGNEKDLAAPPLLSWDRRFQIILDIAQALAFLHLECDPPVVHGDIKPSNVLLTSDYRAKLSDFGLARFKDDGEAGPEFLSQELRPSQELWPSQELEPASPPVDFALAIRSSSSCRHNKKEKDAAMASSSSPRDDEPCWVDLGRGSHAVAHPPSPVDEGRMDLNAQWGKDWWWKQNGSGELSSRDYVAEWIGTQIVPSSNPDWDEERKSSPPLNLIDNSPGVLDGAHFVESGFDAPKNHSKTKQMTKGADACDKKNKKAREWWKEEYFAEISKKGSRRTGSNWFRTNSCHAHNGHTDSNNASKNGRELGIDISFRKGWKKKRSQSVGSEMYSGDIFSRELSSTTSMRGTVCYIAPEYGGCGHLMEKADIYSFGVMILVMVSGRRPLHVLSSPMRLEKANLITWCRQLAHTGNVLELVDESLKDSYNKDQASLCISSALLCLQKAPELRPDSGDIVKILKGEMELPVVPLEFSPSPRSKLFSKSRRKTLPDAE